MHSTSTFAGQMEITVFIVLQIFIATLAIVQNGEYQTGMHIQACDTSILIMRRWKYLMDLLLSRMAHH